MYNGGIGLHNGGIGLYSGGNGFYIGGIELYKSGIGLVLDCTMVVLSSYFDLVVYIGDKICMIIEVQSSPMAKTLKQAVLGCSQVLRYLRSLNSDYSKLIVFCIPSLRSASCIVKIDLEWKNLLVHYRFTCFPTISKGLDSLKEAAIEQSERFPRLLNQTTLERFHRIILLTGPECRSVCGCSSGECQQLSSSQSLLVKCKDGYMHKRLYLYDLMCRVLLVIGGLKDSDNIRHVIVPEYLRNMTYRYRRVCYNPMNFDEASRCWPYLVKEVMVALKELHDIGFSHLDIRLPNICFNKNFEAVLVDIDFCRGKDRYYENTHSCLYRLPENITVPRNDLLDYMQVGWMVAYIFHHEVEEHSRKWLEQPEYIKNDPLISSLVTKCVYDEKKLKFSSDVQTIDVVLKARKNK